MAPYPSNGSLTSSKMTINDSDGWDSQSEWEAYQSASQVEVVNGSVQLAETQFPTAITDRWNHDEGSGSVVANAEGSIDIDLIGAQWQSVGRLGGWATYYDGSDDEFTTASQGDFNAQEYSYAFWVRPDSWDEFAFFSSAVDEITSQGATSGWAIRTFSDGELAHRHADSSSSSTLSITSTGFLTAGEWYFIGVSGNGDSGAMHIWDDTQELFSSTGTGTRGGIGQDRSIEGMYDDRNNDSRGPIEGLVGANYAARTVEMSKTEFADLWNATKP